MVPNINTRGHSFKGVTAYLMHDKGALTSERVAWTSVHNMYTDDIEKAAKVMAWTDEHRDDCRAAYPYYSEENGKKEASTAGRKAEVGNVYHWSLSWALDEAPTREEMEEAAHGSVRHLSLDRHEYYFVAHNDTSHAHVHIVANLVHPETGLVANVYRDQKKLDRWAQSYEQEHGIKCENRNNKYQAWEEKKRGFSEKERRKEYREKVTAAFKHSDGAKGFQAALDLEGLSLARGNKRSFVIVDERGDVYTLGKLVELDGEIKGRKKTKAINEKLESVVETLLMADAVAAQRKAEFEQKNQEREKEKAAAKEAKQEQQPEIWDRDKAELESLKRIEAAAIEKAKAEEAAARAAKRADQKARRAAQRKQAPPEPVYKRVDRDRERAREDSKRLSDIENSNAYYKVDAHRAKLKEAERMVADRSDWLSRILGDTRRAEEHAEKMRLNLEDAIKKQRQDIEAINRRYHHAPAPEPQAPAPKPEGARLAKDYEKASTPEQRTTGRKPEAERQQAKPELREDFLRTQTASPASQPQSEPLPDLGKMRNADDIQEAVKKQGWQDSGQDDPFSGLRPELRESAREAYRQAKEAELKRNEDQQQQEGQERRRGPRPGRD